jgi:hypothetical protein
MPLEAEALVKGILKLADVLVKWMEHDDSKPADMQMRATRTTSR